MSRYQITEIAGYLDIDSTEPGVTYHVVDTDCDGRIVATYRTEQHPHAHQLANVAADGLNRQLAAA